MKRHTGYKRNPRRKVLKPFSSHPLASTTFPSSFSLNQFSPGIFDQGQTGSCVGHARAKGIYIARAAAGRPLGFIPSPADLYRIARCLERQDWSVPLADDGCDPVDTLLAVQKWGARAMGPMASDGRFSDAEPDILAPDGTVLERKINADPSLEDLIADAGMQLLEDYAITETGSARYALIASAISKGLPITLAVDGGSDAFQNYSGGVLSAADSNLDHEIESHEYRFESSGRMILVADNSWGPWGESGRVELDQAYIDATDDIIVCVEGSP